MNIFSKKERQHKCRLSSYCSKIFVEEQIITVYHIHGNVFEELPLVKGKILFKEYDRLYGDKAKFASANPLTDADYDEITEMLIEEWNAQQSHKASGKD